MITNAIKNSILATLLLLMFPLATHADAAPSPETEQRVYEWTIERYHQLLDRLLPLPDSPSMGSANVKWQFSIRISGSRRAEALYTIAVLRSGEIHGIRRDLGGVTIRSHVRELWSTARTRTVESIASQIRVRSRELNSSECPSLAAIAEEAEQLKVSFIRSEVSLLDATVYEIVSHSYGLDSLRLTIHHGAELKEEADQLLKLIAKTTQALDGLCGERS